MKLFSGLVICLVACATTATSASYLYEGANFDAGGYEGGPVPSNGVDGDVGPLPFSRITGVLTVSELLPANSTIILDDYDWSFTSNLDGFAGIGDWDVAAFDVTTDDVGNIKTWYFGAGGVPNAELMVNTSSSGDRVSYFRDWAYSPGDPFYDTSDQCKEARIYSFVGCFGGERGDYRAEGGTWTMVLPTVPVPASGLLLLSAVGALALRRRNQKSV